MIRLIILIAVISIGTIAGAFYFGWTQYQAAPMGILIHAQNQNDIMCPQRAHSLVIPFLYASIFAVELLSAIWLASFLVSFVPWFSGYSSIIRRFSLACLASVLIVLLAIIGERYTADLIVQEFPFQKDITCQ